MAWAELSDVRCYYEVLGHGDPLLLISGLGLTCRTWEQVAPELAQHFSLILLDNRGIGQSQAKRPPRSLADYSADVVELLDELQLDRVHVLGLSLGGIIAQRVAVDHPGRVDRLVLVSCTDSFSPYLQQTAHILAPTLVIAGQDDRLIPSCYAKTMAAKIPNSRFVLLPNVGHNPFQECPQ